jgi:hypothetical protein
MVVGATAGKYGFMYMVTEIIEGCASEVIKVVEKGNCIRNAT